MWVVRKKSFNAVHQNKQACDVHHVMDKLNIHTMYNAIGNSVYFTNQHTFRIKRLHPSRFGNVFFCFYCLRIGCFEIGH